MMTMGGLCYSKGHWSFLSLGRKWPEQSGPIWLLAGWVLVFPLARCTDLATVTIDSPLTIYAYGIK